MFLHEFREDLVLALELLLQKRDPPVLVVAGTAGAGLEGGRGVLEELLLPAVEHRGVDAVLVTQVRDRGVFEEMEPKNGDLLLSCEAIPDFLGHGKTSARDCSLFERAVCPISTEAKQGDIAFGQRGQAAMIEANVPVDIQGAGGFPARPPTSLETVAQPIFLGRRRYSGRPACSADNGLRERGPAPTACPARPGAGTATFRRP